MFRTVGLLLTMSFGALFPNAPTRVGEPAPEFSLASDSGGTVRLSDYSNKSKLVLVFYRGYW
jgi:peroxiredoxin